VAQFLLMPPPGYFDPDGYEGDIIVRGQATYGWGPRPEEVAKRLGATDIRITQIYAPGHFAKMVAKIAFGMAVAIRRIDLDKGRPEVVATIRGDTRGIGHWVGMREDDLDRSLDNILHKVVIVADRGENLMLGRVQLLSDTGTPTYTVVLGTLDAPYVRATS
jgi:hypothetical protein